MRRRDIVTGFAAASLIRLPHALAQQAKPKRLIGVLTTLVRSELDPLVAALSKRLSELGWRPGDTISIDARGSQQDYAALARDAADLIALKADVIIAQGTPPLKAVQQLSRAVPVVFVQVADPVGQGLVQSLARPGGNATGLTNFEFSIGSKWVELLREVDPRVTHVTPLANPDNPNSAAFVRTISSAAAALGIEPHVQLVRDKGEIEEAITSAARLTGNSLILFPDALPIVHRDLIVELAARFKMPAIFPFRLFPANGGLMSYGLDLVAVYRQVAVYADQILRGANPAELPVQAPNKFELVINLKAAKALGLTVPQSLLVSADEVIE